MGAQRAKTHSGTPWGRILAIITSLNRFERKKNIELAIQAFHWVREAADGALRKRLRLFIAGRNNLCRLCMDGLLNLGSSSGGHRSGGYDTRVRESVEYLKELKNVCHDLDLPFTTIWPADQDRADFALGGAVVVFVPSISEHARNYLLGHSKCVVYTPENEHFGIAPIEAMISGTPVVAIKSGGPCETVVDGKTGYLCASDASEVGKRVMMLLDGTVDAASMGQAAREHALGSFSLDSFGDQLERHLLQ